MTVKTIDSNRLKERLITSAGAQIRKQKGGLGGSGVGPRAVYKVILHRLVIQIVLNHGYILTLH